MNKNLLISLVSILTTFSVFAHAELKQNGTVLEYACAVNAVPDSRIQKICFAEVVGHLGQYVTTEDRNGIHSAWIISEDIQPAQIGKGDQKFERLQVQQIGVVQNGQLLQTINAEALVGKILKYTSNDEQVLAINGQIQGEKINASEFRTFVFTMDTGAEAL